MDEITLIFVALILVVICIAPIFMLGYWAAKDAEDRGKSPFWIACACIFFFPWGWIAWLIMRPEPRQAHHGFLNR